jgi:hypothetical protein
MRTGSGKSAICACVAAALAVSSCAVTGRREAPLPCGDAHLDCMPFGASGPGCELAGKVRIDLPRYRFRGLCRILHAPGGRLRIDFEHSSLFGALRERITIFAGDSLAILDDGGGRSMAGEAALDLVAEGLGERIEADDILFALLLAAPRCADMAGPSLERRGGAFELRGGWRGREIELRCDAEKGVRSFKQRFAASGRRYILQYDGLLEAAEWRYPRHIRLSREGGQERISIELVDIKAITPDSLEFEVG